MSTSNVLPAVVTMGVANLVTKPGAIGVVSEVLPAFVSLGGSTQTATPRPV